MTHLSSSAAYVRKQNVATAHAMRLAGGADAFEERVWELLQTPQTVESLERAAGELQSQGKKVEYVMERLLDADLIEISPDS